MITILFTIAVVLGYFGAIYNLHKQEVDWEDCHDDQFEENRLWRERGYSKTQWKNYYTLFARECPICDKIVRTVTLIEYRDDEDYWNVCCQRCFNTFGI